MENVVKLKDWESKGSKKVNVISNGINIFNPDVDGRGTSATVRFSIKKMSYARRLDEIAHHMNYFLEVYDKENELIDKLAKVGNEIHSAENFITAEFIGYLYRTVFTPSIKRKILLMVEDNFVEETKTMSPKNITNLHPSRKALMISATALKLIIPAVFEFIEVKGLIAQDYLLEIYSPLFEKFEETIRVPYGLQALVNFKVKSNHMTNVKLYEALDLRPSEVEKNLYKVLVTETLFKSVFDKDVHRLLYVVIDKQLMYLMASPVKSK